MVDFLDGVGAAAVSMAFPEVFAALQRGVVDCAVTGALSGNTAGWGEVTTHQFPVSLGWAVRFTAVNLDSWERFDPQVRDFFVEQFAQQEEKAWALMKEATADADKCNTGEDGCTYGKKANLTIVPISDEDRATYKQIIEANVLRGWAERCGRECAAEWNQTVGTTVGLSAPVN
jgi:TRAP-type C4-dicarboxylate transport system substrate-binding protein